MSIKSKIRKLLMGIGYELTTLTQETHPLARRKQLLLSYDVNVVLDVVANSGQLLQVDGIFHRSQTDNN